MLYSFRISRGFLWGLLFVFFLLGSLLSFLVFGANDIFLRLVSIGDFSADQSNLERLSSWRLYWDNISFFGMGLGSVGSGASKLSSSQHVNFESFLLGLFYQGGVIQIFFLFAFVLYLASFSSQVRKSLALTSSRHSLSLPFSAHSFAARSWFIPSAFSILPQLFTQATFENPTSFSLLGLLLCCYLRLTIPASRSS